MQEGTGVEEADTGGGQRETKGSRDNKNNVKKNDDESERETGTKKNTFNTCIQLYIYKDL